MTEYSIAQAEFLFWLASSAEYYSKDKALVKRLYEQA